jgi:Nucleotidyltransferase/DNA polymerase involved in DNA repair
MSRRYVAIWFRHLTTDWMIRRKPELKDKAFVLAAPERGRMVVKAVSAPAQQSGIQTGMVVADCRAIHPSLEVFDYQTDKPEQLLSALAEWCIRYTPIAAIDMPDGLILDVSGCPHLWDGEAPYLKDLLAKLRGFGYEVRAGMADTIGTAWAISRYGEKSSIVQPGKQLEAILPLPPMALRLEDPIVERLHKLGLHQVRSFINLPRTALRRRFGVSTLMRIDQALGQQVELIKPVCPEEPYQERLPSLEPIRTATGIEIALKQLLNMMCKRLEGEAKGLRNCIFKCYRIDSNIQKIDIGTSRPSRNAAHLFKLFENKIVQIAPALGIELFVLEAPIVEELTSAQEALWSMRDSSDNAAVAELIDKISGKIGADKVVRYLPAENHWPELSYRKADALSDKRNTEWTDLPRPTQLFQTPEPIEVTVPIPDYPPMLFRHKGTLHQVKRADGPERLEQPWWKQEGLYRDYYHVEDQEGIRYWLFRLGSIDNDEVQWFLHGVFA